MAALPSPLWANDMKSSLAWLMVIVAIGAWVGYGFLVVQLSSERTAYGKALARDEEESLRGESAARLRATVQGTEAERTAIEGLVAISILQAVEVVEQAGRAAGIPNAVVGEASPLGSDANGPSAVSIVVNGSGPFQSLVRGVNLLETLPIPASLEQFSLEKAESGGWRLTARLRVLTSSTKP